MDLSYATHYVTEAGYYEVLYKILIRIPDVDRWIILKWILRQHRHIPNLGKSCILADPEQTEFCSSRNWVRVWSNMYEYVQKGSPVEIGTPTHWKLTGRSMTGLPPVLLPGNILPPPSSRCAFIPTRKISVCLTGYLFSQGESVVYEN